MTDIALIERLARIETTVTQLRNFNREHPGNPNGEVDAPMGARCADTTTGDVYRKTSDLGDPTGWVTP